MILQKEITEHARAWQVPPDTVDKDYVLGHVLSGIAAHYEDSLIFKGGTCLRKCYFPDYRFSEDLDFTASPEFAWTPQELEQALATITDATGIRFHIGPIKTLQHQQQVKGYQVSIAYWGANHSRHQAPPPPERWHTRIKLEVSTAELLLDTPAHRDLYHPYSDDLAGDHSLSCYTLYEVMAEKIRALRQRSYTAPRDFYDLHHLFGSHKNLDWDRLSQMVRDKMAHKDLAFAKAEDLTQHIQITHVTTAWDHSLSHQVPPDKSHTPEEIIKNVINQINQNL